MCLALFNGGVGEAWKESGTQHPKRDRGVLAANSNNRESVVGYYY